MLRIAMIHEKCPQLLQRSASAQQSLRAWLAPETHLPLSSGCILLHRTMGRELFGTFIIITCPCRVLCCCVH